MCSIWRNILSRVMYISSTHSRSPLTESSSHLQLGNRYRGQVYKPRACYWRSTTRWIYTCPSITLLFSCSPPSPHVGENNFTLSFTAPAIICFNVYTWLLYKKNTLKNWILGIIYGIYFYCNGVGFYWLLMIFFFFFCYCENLCLKVWGFDMSKGRKKNLRKIKKIEFLKFIFITIWGKIFFIVDDHFFIFMRIYV